MIKIILHRNSGQCRIPLNLCNNKVPEWPHVNTNKWKGVNCPNCLKLKPNWIPEDEREDRIIIHKQIRNEHYAEGYTRLCYLCNQAVKATPGKMSYKWKNVTCKNCLRLKNK